METLIRKILVPVGVVPPETAGDPPRASDMSLRAIEYARRAAAAEAAKIFLLYAVPQWVMSVAGYEKDDEGKFVEIGGPKHAAPHELAREQMTIIQRQTLPPSIASEVLIRIGEPARTILEVEKELSIDLIIIPRRRKGNVINETLFGSIAGKVVAAASCDVLTIRRPPSE